MPELVNAVGGGDLGRELSLQNLADDLGDETRYDPEYWPGIVFKPSDLSSTILIFSSGKYNIAGADSIRELHMAKDRLFDELNELDIEYDRDFEVRNLVYLEDYGREIRLEALSVALGLEQTEYEPEQFPGILYKPDQHKGIFLIFRTGKILSTGSNSEENTDQAFEDLFNKLDALFDRECVQK